jgi:hypothetical protein
MTIFRRLGAAVMLGWVTGCAVIPYQPAANEVMVPVKYLGAGSPRMCKDGKMYSLPSANYSDTYQVPAGQLISLGATLQSSGYNVNYYCSPWLAFKPEANRSYVANAGLSSQGRCFIEVVREDNTRDTGVALEPSVTRAPACTPPAASQGQAAPAAAPAADAASASR